VVTAFDSHEVDAVFKAQTIDVQGLISMGVPRFGAQYLKTELGLLQGFISVGKKRTVVSHVGSFKKLRPIDTSKSRLRLGSLSSDTPHPW
jgi:hypothetical protein